MHASLFNFDSLHYKLKLIIAIKWQILKTPIATEKYFQRASV